MIILGGYYKFKQLSLCFLEGAAFPSDEIKSIMVENNKKINKLQNKFELKCAETKVSCCLFNTILLHMASGFNTFRNTAYSILLSKFITAQQSGCIELMTS